MILIPAHNEEATIAGVVRKARRRWSVPVVVIDDCSRDRTAELGRRAGAIVLPLSIRLGAWGATQTGLRFAARAGWPIVVTLDADGQHESDQIATLIRPIQTGQADVVVGACPLRASPARRVAWRWFRLLTGVTVHDVTSGFRAYNSAAVERLSRPEASLLDYQDVGVLLILQRCRLRVREVAVPMGPRRHGKSRVFESWWTVFRYMLQTSVLCIARFGDTGAADAPPGRPGQERR
jgi:glycosyltransferase involved in cell wall biosynthesis